MKINKKTLAQEFVSKLIFYSEMVDFCEERFKDVKAEEKATIWRAKAWAVQELAMTFFGVEEMSGHWRKDLIEKLKKIAKG
jgi:hypothetical protein